MLLIVSNCFVITSNYHKSTLPVVIVIIVNSHEVMYCLVNYIELSIASLQCCAIVVNFAKFHTNCYELAENLAVSYYELSLIVNNYDTVTIDSIVLEKVIPRGVKLSQ